jgi:hypothetical protein
MIVTETIESILGQIPAKPDPNKPAVFKEDPIALSCASYRRAAETGMTVRFQDLNQCIAQPQDRDMAKQVRQYYQNKIAVKTLTSPQPLTPFYHDLYEMLLGQVELQQRHIGMIHRLPYFYVEDQNREQLKQLIKDKSLTPDWIGNAMLLANGNAISLAGKETHALTPVMKIFRSRRGSESQEYWFQNHVGQPVMWSVLNGNALRSVVDSLFMRSQISVSAYFHTGQVAGQDFYHYYMSDVAVESIS